MRCKCFCVWTGLVTRHQDCAGDQQECHPHHHVSMVPFAVVEARYTCTSTLPSQTTTLPTARPAMRDQICLKFWASIAPTTGPPRHLSPDPMRSKLRCTTRRHISISMSRWFVRLGCEALSTRVFALFVGSRLHKQDPLWQCWRYLMWKRMKDLDLQTQRAISFTSSFFA